MNLSNCLKTLGIEEVIDVDGLSTEIQELQKQGLSRPESHARAVAARVKRLEGERANILNQVGPLSADKGLGTKLNQRAAQDAIRSQQSNDLGPTSVESKDTIQAGVDAIGRGGRLAAYSADPKGFQGVKIPGGMVVIPSVDGGSYVTEKVRASEIAELDRNGQQAEILGYPSEKGPNDNAVARAVDSKGRTVQDVSFHDDDVGVGRLAALEQGRVAAGRGGKVEIITPEDALNDRAEQIENSTEEQLAEQAGMQPEMEVDIKHNTTGRIIKDLYGDAKISLKNGVRKVTLAPRDPNQTQGDPTETHPLVVRGMAKVFDDGKTEDRGRIEVYNPTSKTGTKTRVSLPAVISLGRTLNRLNDVTSNRKTDLLTGLGHLYAHNFIPMQVTVKRDGKHQTFQLNKIVKGEPTKLALPLDTVVDGRGDNTITFGDITEAGPKKDAAKAMKKKLIDKHDKLSAQLNAMTKGTQRMKNKAALKYKKNTKALYDEVQALENTLKKQGVKFTKSDVDPKDFEEAPQGATGPEIEVEMRAQIKGKPKGQRPAESPEAAPDTRGLPSDEDQARDSARDVLRKKGWRPESVFAHRNNKVSVSEDIGQKLGNMAADIFKLIGIKSRVDIVGDKGARDYIKLMKEAKNDPNATKEFIEVMDQKIETLEAKLAEGQAGFVIYNDNFENAEDRVPTIYINDSNTKTSKRVRVLVHELGHLVQRTMFDQAPKATQEAIIRSMGRIKASTSNRFEENFANMLWRYLVNLDVESMNSQERHEASVRLRSIVNQVNPREGMKKSDAQIKATQKDLQVATKFFKKLAAKLRQMWEHLSKVYKLDEEYQEFVNAMVGVRQQREGIAPMTSRFGKKYENIVRDFTSGPFMAHRTDAGPKGDNYSAADLRAFGNAAMRGRMAKNVMSGVKTAREALDMVNEKVLKSADAYLRYLDQSPRMQWLANEFHHQPGLKKKGRAYFEEVRHRMGNRQVKLNEILRGLPMSGKKRGKATWWRQDKVDTNSPEYTQLWEKLQDGTTISEFRAMGGVVGEAGVKIRQYLEEQRQWLESQGVPVAKRANYWPVVMNASAWASEAGKTRIRQIFQAHGYTLDYANKVIEAVNQGDGYLADILSHDEQLLGPSFNFMKARKLSPQVLKALSEDPSGFMLKDMQGILQRYTHSAVERGITQKRWGLTPNEKVQMQQEFTDLKIGQHLNSPVAKIHYNLQKALKDGEITHAEFVTVKNRVLEAYFGRLGANLDPRWQKFQSFMIIGQNMRILSLATISAFVDAPQVAWRAGDAKTAYAGLKNYFDKASREELYEAAHLMGAIQDDLTEHVLNDQSTNAFMSPGAKAMNETFFRFIGMHKWTNMTRVMGLSTAREFLNNRAHDAAMGDAKAQADLAELGVTPEEIWAWQDAGRPSLEGAHDNVISALNTFIDEAVIRPDATTRPAWASDRHWQLFFHLKSFMWGYQEIIWKRIWNRAKAQPGAMNQLTHGGMSAAALMAVTLPVALAGYELRRKISWFPMGAPARSERTGFDYLGEVAERAGYPGIFQFILDANQAEEFGRSSLLSLMGPTVTHLEEFIRDDMTTWSSRSIPFLAQSGAARTIYRNAIRDLAGD